MSADVQPMLQPDEAAMRQHLEHLFGGFLDGCQHGRIELAWTAPDPDESGRFKLKYAETFDVEDTDALVRKAAEVNSQPRTNVYIGAALRKPETCPVGRCDDDDFYATTAYWADLDDKDANDHASGRFAETAPSMVVRTGEHPHWRHQLWWRLSEPVTDPERARAAVSGIAAALGGDGTIANPSRVMRLAGTIAWDQKPGRRPELTRIIELKTPGLRAYYPDHVERSYPPLVSLAHIRTARHAPGPNVGIVRESSVFGHPTGKVVDGREKYMTDLICARLVDYCGQFGATPTTDELFEYAWDVYERSTDLSRPGRNKPEFMDKCRSTMRRFEMGKIRGARSLEEAVASYRMRREAKRENVRHEAEREEGEPEVPPGDDLLEYLDIAQIKAMEDPKWLIDGLAVENALGFIFGAPGSGKTFVALSQALSLAAGLPDWWGRAIQRTGPVIYISAEGQADLKFRIAAWEMITRATSDAAPFYLIRQNINFMREEDVGRLMRTLEAIATKVGDPVAVYVDTVSRVLPGADENLQKDMTLFIAACDEVRQRFNATVIGVHHTSRNGNLRGSTVFDGAGDFLLQIEREEGTENGQLIARKIKAAEDGWKESFKLAKIDLPFDHSSLVAIPAPAPEPSENAWPDKPTCRRILQAIAQAWQDGMPWSPKPQTIKEGRWAPRMIHARFDVPSHVAEDMIQTWQDNGVLKYHFYNRHKNLKGLEVVGSID
jgi:hypothetical protein